MSAELKVLKFAQQRLRTEGWTQHPTSETVPKTCLGLALVDEISLYGKDGWAAVNRVAKLTKWKDSADLSSIYRWNDVPGRTFEEVDALLTTAIQQVDDPESG